MAAQPGLLRANEGRTILGGPLGAVLLGGAEATDGVASFIIHPLASRTLGSPLHTHRNEDEWSFVLDGELGVQIGDQTFTARAGDFVLKPRGVPHAFWNSTDQPARFLEVITPGGFEGYFERHADVFAAGGPPDMNSLMAAAAEYDLEVDPGSIPRLAQQHGLQLAP